MPTPLPDDVLLSILEILPPKTLRRIRDAVPESSLWWEATDKLIWRRTHITYQPSDYMGPLLPLMSAGKHIHTLKLSEPTFGTFHRNRDPEAPSPEENPFSIFASHVLQFTPNITHLLWGSETLPDSDTLERIDSLVNLQHVFFPGNLEQGWPIGNLGRSTDADLPKAQVFARFLAKIGPKLTSLHLFATDEDAFNIFSSNSRLLSKVERLTINIMAGVWDWDGDGSPQSGPTAAYQFPTLSCADHLHHVKLITSDLSVTHLSPTPLDLFSSHALHSLSIVIKPCFSWKSLTNVRMFVRLDPADFPSLRHLTIFDTIRNIVRTRGPDVSESFARSQYNESARVFSGLSGFVSGLQSLDTLWVNESALLGDKSEEGGDQEWAKRGHESLEEFMVANGRHWPVLQLALHRLQSVRVGFGPLTTITAHQFISALGPQIRDVGFEFDWVSNGMDQPFPDSLISALAGLPNLRQFHLTSTRPISSSTRRWHDDDVLLADVRKIFLQCQNLSRVGVGRGVVWERKLGGPVGSFQLLSLGRGETSIDDDEWQDEDGEQILPFFNAGWEESRRGL